MNKSLKKKKQYNDTQLFVDGLCLLKTSMLIVNNINKDYKIQFGNDFIKDICDMVNCFSMSYRHRNEKIRYGMEAYRLSEKIDISLRIMFETGIISIKQNTQLSLLLGNLIIQLKGWIISIGGEIENADGVSES